MGSVPSKEPTFIKKHYPGFIAARDAIRAARDRGDDAEVREAADVFFDFPYRHQDVFSDGRFSLGYTVQTPAFRAYRRKAARASVTFVEDTIKEFVAVPWFCAVAIAWGYYRNIAKCITGGLLGPDFDRVVALAEEAWPRVVPEDPWFLGPRATDCTVYREPPSPQERHRNVDMARRLVLAYAAVGPDETA